MTEEGFGRRWFLEQTGLLALGGAASLAGCAPCSRPSDATWLNAAGTAGVSPKAELEPASLSELVRIVQRATSEKARVRMTGSRHSFSDVALTDDYLLRPVRLSRPLELARNELKTGVTEDPYLVRVEGGMRVRELNTLLFNEHGAAFDNLGGYDIQTIVGVAMTSTHGSGLKHGPIASHIQSIEMVTKGGAVMKLEPSNGITDPARFQGHVVTPEGNVPAELLQDDETFNAAVVSLGCVGVVYAVVLRAVPKYGLREQRELVTWGKLKHPGGFLDRLLRGEKLDPGGGPDPEHYEVYFNPYPSHRRDPPSRHRCLLTRRYRVAAPAAPNPRPGRSIFHALKRVTREGNRLAQFLNERQELIPAFNDLSLIVLQEKSYVARSYEVFNLGSLNEMRVYGIEMAFDLKQTVEATEHCFEVARKLAEEGIYHSAPPSLRFVKRSDALLSMMHGRDTATLEMGMLVCAKGAETLLKTHEREFIDNFGARPHWGLDLDILSHFDEVRALYPESADRWLAVYRKLNHHGTFNGAITDRLGISV